ncbi:MAG: phenylalanine--tRNA ligase subunit beta [Candidatus Eremiobacteraeota bacterium]|nr:phenylalanine--tRNA ligase subunit beta [Candidatus Eremiobacteraeota bacterium]
MPVIGIPVKMLNERIETKLDPDTLVEKLQYLGCDVEGYATLRRFGCANCDNLMEITPTENPPVVCDACGQDFKAAPDKLEELGETEVIRMELLAVRPDMFDPGGLARVLRNYLGEKDVPARYELGAPQLTVTVSPELSRPESYRPRIACAVVRGVTLDDDIIKVIMKLQENLHWALGRDRKRASIGVYDLDTLEGDIRYTSIGPEERTFVPLGTDTPHTPKEVLEKHPKGVAYARLLKSHQRYPLLVDSKDQVLSMPPIINSEETRITRSSKNFFIDVTGTEERIVNKTLNTLVTSLLELDPKARLEQVKIAYPDQTVATPDLAPQQVRLRPERAGQTIGVDLDRAGVVAKLKAMGHGVEDGGEELVVSVPAYRNDIMHEIDLIEDVAIAYGYHNIVTSLVPTLTVGKEQPIEAFSNIVRRAMTGMGYFEVLTLILSNEENQFTRLGLEPVEDYVKLDNPISVEQTMIRRSLLPGLLDTFAANIDHELPQRIFEVGNASQLDEAVETRARERRLLAGAAIGPRVDYSEIRSSCEALLRELGYRLEVEPRSGAPFIAGRGATVIAARGDQKTVVGQMGEVHPEVLEHYKLAHPVSFFEVELELLT